MELLITMAIIGILSAVMIIGSSGFLPHWQLSSSARLLTSKIRQAQEEAVAVQKPHRILFKTTTPPVTYQIIKVDGGDHEVETITMPANIGVQLNIPNPFTFNIDGAPDFNGTIIINSGTAIKTIEILPAGAIKLQ